MTRDTVVSLTVDAMELAMKIGLPLLLAGLLVGLIVSIFQAVTQIQEQTLTFIPKIIATGAVIIVGGPWMLDQLILYMHDLYSSIPQMSGP
jgi:flagellar biosynthetic protein FliQ